MYGFMAHVVPYWIMVYIYDKRNTRHFKLAVYNSLINQLLVTAPAIYIGLHYYPIHNNNLLLSLVSLPVLVITGDIYFYTSHRIMHTKYMWKYHKSHHADEVCIAKALDADRLEHLICNIGSFVIGFYILLYFGISINIYVIYLWIALSTISTCISHSSSMSKTPYDTGNHRIHHELLKYNFGTGFYIMDRLFGSYKTIHNTNKHAMNRQLIWENEHCAECPSGPKLAQLLRHRL